MQIQRYRLIMVFFFFGIIVYIYRNWLLLPQIIGGDWPYYYPEFLNNFSLIPTIWTSWQGNGLGGVQTFLGLHTFSSFLIVVFYQWLHIPWEYIYKFGWFFSTVFLSCISIAVLLRTVWKSIPFWVMTVASLIYSTNTYILMLTAGGQMGVALAYAITPFVFLSFIELMRRDIDDDGRQKVRTHVRKITIAGILLSVQLAIDPRIAYVCLIALTVYSFIFGLLSDRRTRIYICIRGGLSLLVSVFVSVFWLLPTVFVKDSVISSIGDAYTTVGALRFFSFADFSHALSLLQPNWPENVFGKTYFLQSEFLILPIIAFSSLWMIRRLDRDKRKIVLAFTCVGLIGVFLSKGANDPFSGIYTWVFIHVPGFILFRDSTKFYVIIALAYAVLVPISLYQLEQRIARDERAHYRQLALVPFIGFIIFWLFTIRPAWLGELKGTFSGNVVPEEYLNLRTTLSEDNGFYRTLWIPRFQRFGFTTVDHMAVEAEPLLHATTSAELAIALSMNGTEEKISGLGIQYVIIPYDPYGEIFVTDRTYDEYVRKDYEAVIERIPWLTKIQQGKLTVYKTNSVPKNRFWLEPEGFVTYSMHNQTEYTVQVSATKISTLHFSQTFHPGWKAQIHGNIQNGTKDRFGLTSFDLGTKGNYSVHIYFDPQKYVDYGAWVSLLTLGILGGFIILL